MNERIIDDFMAFFPIFRNCRFFPYLNPNAQKTEKFWGEKTLAPLFLHQNATFSGMPFLIFQKKCLDGPV